MLEWNCFYCINQSAEEDFYLSQHLWAVIPCSFMTSASAWPGQWRSDAGCVSKVLKSRLWVSLHVFELDTGPIENVRMFLLTYFLSLITARGLIKKVSWGSPAQRQSPSRQVLWLVWLVKIRSSQSFRIPNEIIGNLEVLLLKKLFTNSMVIS